MLTQVSIIDAWMQFPNRDFLLDPMFDALRRWPTHWRELVQRGSAPTPEDTLRSYDESVVSVALASAWWGPRGVLIANDDVAAISRRFPAKVIGVGSVDLARPMNAVRELRRCVRSLGFKGARILPWLWGLPPDDRRYYPIYAECVELGIPFCTQVGHAGPMSPSEPGRPIPYLDHVAHEFPDLTIVGGHIGFPWTGEMISLAMKHPNVYIDTSAYKPSRYPADLVCYLRGSGRRKVIFGTNYPMLTPNECLAEVNDLGLDSEAMELFLGGNARRVFRI